MDLSGLFHVDAGLLEIILRTGIVYIALMIGLRLTGKRQLGQLNLFDFVLILTISNAVQNAMVGSDSSVTGGLTAAATLLAFNAVFSYFRQRSRRFRKALEGTPTLLVLHGREIPANMQREGIDHDELVAALREHGVDNVADARMVVLELDGTISVVPMGSEVHRGRRPVKFFRHGG